MNTRYSEEKAKLKSSKSSGNTNTNSKSNELGNQSKTVKQCLTAMKTRHQKNANKDQKKSEGMRKSSANSSKVKPKKSLNKNKEQIQKPIEPNNNRSEREANDCQNKEHKKSEGMRKPSVNSSKAKPKKSLNKNKEQIQKPIERNTNRSEREGNDTNEDTITIEDNDYQNQAMGANDAMPELICETISGSSPSSTTGLATAPEPPTSATNAEANENHWPYPAKSSASLCAQYLKACGELSRKLSKYELTSDEMSACFKYSTIRDSLGDVEAAAQKIAFASQEIRLGAAFNIQHPNEAPDGEECPSGSGAHQTAQCAQTSGTKTNPNPMLCSPLNANFRANSAVNYSPVFASIPHNYSKGSLGSALYGSVGHKIYV